MKKTGSWIRTRKTQPAEERRGRRGLTTNGAALNTNLNDWLGERLREDQ